MNVVVVDYGSGNLRSAAKALECAAAMTGTPARVVVSAETAAVAAADRIVLPGVGAFGDCRQGLEAVPGMIAALSEAVVHRGRPFLGICVGMQLMATCGREHGVHPGFDWIAGEVVPLSPDDPALKVPHMGWNELNVHEPVHPVLADLGPRPHVYFVHGYHFIARDASDVRASVDYGGPVAAAIGRDNLFGTQFHPEKSQAVGLTVLGNFLRWCP
ncbi:MAG: imidazole glycerol phosphate synthase subunit HisH [Alphaproteobacteria bacterium]|nr:MAG: imidazole glycerol phosphate synthase subunit HisH [Alphaproteobacteria bacterium]